MITRFSVVVTLFIAVSSPPAARACPVCDLETGRQVRAGIFDQEFGMNLIATALPFVVFLGIVAGIHLSGGPRVSAAPPSPETDPTDRA